MNGRVYEEMVLWFAFLEEKGYGKWLPRVERIEELILEFRERYPHLNRKPAPSHETTAGFTISILLADPLRFAPHPLK